AHQGRGRRRERLRGCGPHRPRRVHRVDGGVRSHVTKAPRGEFASRHIGTDARAQKHMLETLGYGSVDELLAAAVPDSIVTKLGAEGLPAAATEHEALSELRSLAARNTVN